MRFARVAVRTAGRRQLAAGREREGSWQEAAGSRRRAGREQRAERKGQSLDAMRHALCAGGGKNSWQEAAGSWQRTRSGQQAAGSGQAESRAQRGKRRTPCAMRFAPAAKKRAARTKTAVSAAVLNRLNNSTDSITQQRAITFQGTQRCTVAGRRGTSRRARRALGPVSRTARTGNAAEQSGPRSGVRRHRTHDA